MYNIREQGYVDAFVMQVTMTELYILVEQNYFNADITLRF